MASNPPTPAPRSASVAAPTSAQPPSALGALRSIRLDGAHVDDVSMDEAIARIADGAKACRAAGRGAWVVTPNLDHLWLLRRDAAFRDLYEKSLLSLCDGKPLLWIAKRQGTPLPHGTVAGSSLFAEMCQRAPALGLRLFFLGGAPGRAEEAAAILRAKAPGIQIVGMHCPPLGFEKNDSAWGAMMEALAAADASREGPLDVVFLALGAPKSEKACVRIVEEGGPPAVYVNVGAAFDFVCGKPKRAPAWIRRLAMEWLYRLLRDPKRLFRRYILHDLPLLAELMLKAGKKREKRGGE